MEELDSEVTRPLVVPRAGSGNRRSALLLGSGVLAFVATVDQAVSGLGARTPIWVGWIVLFLVAAWIVGHSRGRAGTIAGVLAGVGSVAALTALAWITGEAASPFLHFLIVIPLLSAIAAPGELRDPSVLGAAVILAGAALLVHGGAPGVDLVLWVAITSAAVVFALLAGELERRRQSRILQLERERADALARLAELERARAAGDRAMERWAAIGQVAEQVAHDVNSPLGALRSSIAYAGAEIEAGRPEVAVEALRDAAECAERIRLIVAELRVRGGFPTGGERP